MDGRQRRKRLGHMMRALQCAFHGHFLPCVAVIAIVFFTWAVLEPWNLARAAQDPPRGRGSAAQKSKNAAEKFEHTLRDLKQKITKVDQYKAEGEEAALDLESIERDYRVLEAADPEIQAQFQETEARIKAAGLSAEILERHRRAFADYKANCNELLENLRSLRQLRQELSRARQQGDQAGAVAKSQELQQQIRDIRSSLKDKVKEPPHTPLDPNNLPHRTPKVQERKPRLKKEEFTELQKPIQLAFNGDVSSLQLAQANSDLPTDAHLQETIDAQFSQGIQDLAASLDNDPLKIYNWVRQNITFVPTFGSIQGSESCRLSKECNAHDTASLLIALLRVAGIPARYVIGTVEVAPDLFRSAMGAFTDVDTAGQLAATGGVPTLLVTDATNMPIAVRMEHVWVEAYIDYVPSRGAVNGAGDTWVPLDVVLKPNRFQPPLDIESTLGVEPQTILDDIAATGTIGPSQDSITDISQDAIEGTLTALQEDFRTHIEQNLPDEATVAEVVGAREVNVQGLPIFPSSLPYQVLAVGGRIAELAPAVRHAVSIQILDEAGITQHIRFDRSLPELAGKRVSFYYVPATDADEETIEAFGGLLESVPYLVNLQPVIALEAEPVGVGPAIQMGTNQKVRVSFSEPDGTIDAVTHLLPAGTHAALALDLQRVTREFVEGRQTQYEAAFDLLGVEDVNLDDIMGEVLYAHGYAYFAQLDALSQLTSHQLNVAVVNAQLNS